MLAPSLQVMQALVWLWHTTCRNMTKVYCEWGAENRSRRSRRLNMEGSTMPMPIGLLLLSRPTGKSIGALEGGTLEGGALEGATTLMVGTKLIYIRCPGNPKIRIWDFRKSRFPEM